MMSVNELVEDSLVKQFVDKNYRLLEKVGRGGFGSIYKAEQENTGQLVAIKFLILDQDFDGDKRRRYIQRFERETLLCSRLNHPNIVHLLDKGCCNNYLFYAVFEFVEGQSLKDRIIEKGELPPVDTGHIMLQVIEALAYAHECGVIHRDIKPANIMLQRFGTRTHVKVLDFGIGTLVHEAKELDFKSITLTKEVLGTPSYAAPEQLRGEPPTPKTDLYVWALVFIECLTGRPAIYANNLAAIFHKQLSASNIPIPAAIASHPIGNLLRSALNKKVQDRHVSAKSLFDDMSKISLNTLVGDFLSAPHSLNRQDYKPNINGQETIVSENFQSYSTLSERKQITALCVCCNVRYASEDRQYDLDIIEELQRDLKNLCIDTATRYSAYQVGVLGDTLLFYFGYPRVSDSDSRLCSRTALVIISYVMKRNALWRNTHGVQAEVRIGVHTGIMTSYADSTPEGETADIAMGLARLSPVNQVLCSDNFRQLLDAYLDFELKGGYRLGSSVKAIPCYQLIQERQVEAFGFLRAKNNAGNFVGRSAELDQLVKTYIKQPPQANVYKALHLKGEAGLGKSRLVLEFLKRASKYRHKIVQCLPENQNLALFPVLNLFKTHYRVSGNDKDVVKTLYEDIRCKVYVNDVELQQQAISVLCAWLALPLPDDLDLVVLPPQQQPLLFSTLIGLLSIVSADFDALDKQSTVYVFEDVHWADPITVEFIYQFSKTTLFSLSANILITTSREDLPKKIEDVSSELDTFKTLTLKKLTRSDIESFSSSLFDNMPITPDVMNILVERTDGIPLFIEELVKMIKQKDLVHKLNGVVHFIENTVPSDIPISLRDTLQQKLDALSTGKDTAQVAATIGREFDYTLLSEISDKSEAQLQLDIQQLLDNDLVIQQHKIDSNHYIFNHALICEAAYTSQSKNQKETQHLALAKTLEKNYNVPCAIMARHYELGGSFQRACELWKQSGENRVKNGFSVEANLDFDRAIMQLPYLQENVENKRMEVNIRYATSMALAATIGYAHPMIKPHHERAVELCNELNNPKELYYVLWSINLTHVVRADHLDGIETADQLCRMADIDGSPELTVPALFLKGTILWAMGRFAEAYGVYQRSLGLYDYEKHHTVFSQFPFDPGVSSYVLQASICWSIGHFSQADKYHKISLQLAEKSNDPTCKIHVLARSAYHSVLRRDFLETAYFSQKCYELSEKCGFDLWKSNAQVLLGWVACKKGNFTKGLNLIEEGYSDYIKTGAIGHASWLQTLHAESLFWAGNLLGAQVVVEQAIDLAKERVDHFYLPESFRVLSCILKALAKENENNIALACEAYLQHKTLAKEQGAKGYLALKFEEIENA